MDSIIAISGLEKTYASGHRALKTIDLEIRRGEIFALLGPNGAGKTTLIGIVCGLVRATAGTVIADGHDIARDYRAARASIGLVPQELATDMFEKVRNTVAFSRGLFGCPPDPVHVEKVLRDLSLWDKRDAKVATLSGGMKRRLLIAKALAHEPKILFLDEPTAGVDVELRRDMWAMVRRLREQGVTIILTTHYIEEAEEMADRVGVIDKGEIILVEEKHALMSRFGQTLVTLGLPRRLEAPPPGLEDAGPKLSEDGRTLTFTLKGESGDAESRVPDLLRRLAAQGVDFNAIDIKRPSLEDIFVDLVGEGSMNLHAIRAIYKFEMARAWRTRFQSIASPVLSTSLYFVVFGSAIGGHMASIDGVSYGAFIVPGMTMLTLLNQSLSNSSFAIYMPRFSGTIFEVLSAPVSAIEVVTGYVGAAATKSILLGAIILGTARLFVPYSILHPLWLIGFLLLTSLSFCLFGFILGLWADGFEKLQIVPLMIVTPLTFLGGTFYSIRMLPPFWQKVTLFNPVVYLVAGFRWAFFGTADVEVGVSLGMTALFMAACIAVIVWVFRTGYKLRA